MKSIKDLLTELGNNADEIAETLYKSGIKGQVASLEACPIARYIQKNGYPNVRIGMTLVTDQTNQPSVYTNLPTPVKSFIEWFDIGYYLYLRVPPLTLTNY